MLLTVTFNDIFKKSFVNAFTDNRLSYPDILLSLLFSIVIGMFIFLVYRRFFRGVVYNQQYNISLVLMTILTTMIILAISSNIVLSLGMVGALSIVRYRTAVKEPMDLMYMFWAVASGIACGAGLFPLAILCCLVILVALLLLGLFKVKNKAYVLIVRYAPEVDDMVRMALAGVKYEVKSKSSGNDLVELTVELRLKGDNHQIVHKLSSIPNVQHAVLVQYTGDYAN